MHFAWRNEEALMKSNRSHPVKLNSIHDLRRRKYPITFIFSLCPDSHFAYEQFRNCLAQGKNSHFAHQSENSPFAQDNSRIVPIPTLCRTDQCALTN